MHLDQYSFKQPEYIKICINVCIYRMTSPLTPMYAKEDLLMSSADTFYLVSTLNGLVRQSKYSRANVYYQNVIGIKLCISYVAIVVIIQELLYSTYCYKYKNLFNTLIC